MVFGVRRPSPPGVLVAKDRLAHTAYGRSKCPTSCASGCSSRHRSRKLRALAGPWKVSTYTISQNDGPDLTDCGTVAVGIIPQIRSVVNPEPCLRGEPAGDRPEAGTKNADEEFERRNAERRLLQELSRYYALQRGKKPWTRLSLLSNGKHGCHHSAYQRPFAYLIFFSVVKDLEDLSALSGSPDEPSS